MTGVQTCALPIYLETTKYICEYSPDHADIEDPPLYQSKIITGDFIYKVGEKTPLFNRNNEESQTILYLTDDYVFTFNANRKLAENKNCINIYSLSQSTLMASIDVDRVEQFKNTSDFIICHIAGSVYLIRFKDLI